MKRLLIPVVILFAIATTQMFAQPKLEIEGGKIHDFGKVSPEDSPLKVKKIFRNTGDETLIIKRVKPGCGCTTAPLDKDTIQPGDFATLDIKLNVGNYSDQVKKSIAIYSNDEDSRQSVTLKAFVVRPITYYPRILSLRNMTVGEESSAYMKLRNRTEEDITIKEIKTTPEDIKVNIEEGTKLKPNIEQKLQIFFTPKKSGRLKGQLILKTDHPEVSFIRVNIWGMAR
jgi:hypothetical protein